MKKAIEEEQRKEDFGDNLDENLSNDNQSENWPKSTPNSKFQAEVKNLLQKLPLPPSNSTLFHPFTPIMPQINPLNDVTPIISEDLENSTVINEDWSINNPR